ncbi:MAG: VWA domain-containing protein [Leptolyngbya sp. DLM2.Bin15]|nr:MAG: VWA domain-containing protein [Leptolyngbya sp. DLM2.Bin15]
MKFMYLLPTVAVLGLVGLVRHGGNLVTAQTAPAVRSTPGEPRMANPDTSVLGGLYVQNEGGSQVFPLIHTDVQAQVSGNVARVEVTQTFENPFEDPLEAIYVFPLPDEAAVDDMEIRIGDRIIRGEIKPREEAQAIYQQAIDEGRTAGLLEQERANVFTQSLANILPGEQIDVTIRYTESLTFEGAHYEFVFPMVVGPRYIPGPATVTGNTPQVPDATRITPPVIPPDQRSGHDIQVTVNLDAGVPITNITSPSHTIQTTSRGRDVHVQLDAADTIPNKDLILRYQVMSDRPQATVLTQRHEEGGHFAAYLIPAIDYPSTAIVPKDVVFLMDTSGSQMGDPLLKSQELMRRMINGLNPNDTFTIIDFATTTEQLSATPLPNTPENRRRAIAYVDQLTANGGTELLNGIRAVLDFPPAPEGRLRSVVLLTDGYIGNDAEIIAEVQQRLAPGNRLYSFGVGSSVNRFLLDRLAEAGRGTSQVIRHDEPSGEVADRFFRQINNPVLTAIEVTWEGEGDAPEIYPSAIPDLFAEQPLVIFGRKTDGQSGVLRIRGTAAGGVPFDETLAVNFESRPSQGAIAQLWGRARIKDLMNQLYAMETVEGVNAVTQTALAYRLLSQYTAFVAVTEEVRVDPDGTRRTVEVPVELPDGVRHEGIFGPDFDFDSTDLHDLMIGSFSAPPPSLAAPFPTSTAGSRQPTRSIPQSMPSFELEDVLDDIDDEHRLEIIELTLDGVALTNSDDIYTNLDQYLQNLYISDRPSGILLIELRLVNGSVQQVLLDDQASTLDDLSFIQQVRNHLRGWRSPASTTGTLRLSVRVTNES